MLSWVPSWVVCPLTMAERALLATLEVLLVWQPTCKVAIPYGQPVVGPEIKVTPRLGVPDPISRCGERGRRRNGSGDGGAKSDGRTYS